MKIENYVKKLIELIYSDGVEEETRREIIHTISDMVDELVKETVNKNADKEVAVDQIVYSGKWFIKFDNSADARKLSSKADKILKENKYLNPSDINKIVKDLGYNNPVFDEDDSKEVKFNDCKISFLKDETAWRVDFIPKEDEKKEGDLIFSNFAFIRSCKNKDKGKDRDKDRDRDKNEGEDNKEQVTDQIINSGKWFIELNNSADARAIVSKVDKVIKENIYFYPSDINKIVKDLGYNDPVFYENDLLEEVRFNDSKILCLKDGTTWRVDFIPTKEKNDEALVFSNFAVIGSSKNKNKAIESVDSLNNKASRFGYFTKLAVTDKIRNVIGQDINDLCPDVSYLHKYYGCAVYEDNDGEYTIGYWDSDSKKTSINILLGKVEGKKVYPND